MLIRFGRTKLLEKYDALVEQVKTCEEQVEALREAKEDLKYKLDVREAELYLETKNGPEKLTEAALKALIASNSEVKASTVELIAAENRYKAKQIELGYLYNKLGSLKLHLS